MNKIRGLFFIPEQLREEIEGDLLQRFEKDSKRHGYRIANIKLALSVIKFFRPGIILRNKIKYQPPMMIGNYFKVMLRHLARHKVNAFVNILGLTTGITFALVIGVYVWGEIQVNKQLKDVERLYVFDSYDREGNWAGWFVPGPMGKTLAEEYPQLVEDYYRFTERMMKVSHEDKHVIYQGMMGDSTLLSMLGLPVLYGDPNTALNEPNSVVITEKVANTFFGRTDVVGETLTIPDRNNVKVDYNITAVLPKIQRNSITDLVNIDAQIFLTRHNNANFNYPNPDQWENGAITYVKLARGADVNEVNKKAMELKKERVPAAQQDDITHQLKSLANYHLLTNNGSVMTMLLTLSGIAVFILILAAINFINLSISGATTRLKEIGVRKVIGSLKRQIALQFLTESVMMTVFAGVCALLLYALLGNYFGSVFDTTLLQVTEFPIAFWVWFAGLLIATGLLPGLYPSLLLSSYKTVDSLKGNLKSARSANWLSRGLVGVQFTISIFVFICAIVINNQISLFLNSNLGYDRSYVLTVSSVPRIFSPEGMTKMEAAKNELIRLPEVENASLSWEVPNGNDWGDINLYQEGGDRSKAVSMRMFLTDPDYANVYGIGIVDGKFMTLENEAWKYNDIVINESAAKTLKVGVGDRVKPLFSDTVTYTIKGIVKDITNASMREERSRIAFMHPRQFYAYRFFSLKLRPGNIAESVTAIENKWREIFPEDPFNYLFMDDRIAALYKTEMQLQKAADIGTGVMMVIVAIGLLGMVSLAVSRRVKEIGVRKVLGASVVSIVRLFSVEYVSIILISFMIAIPFAWLEINNWLQGFAFRIELAWWMFALPGAVLLMLTLLLVLATTRKAAVSNPVDALRSE